MAHVAGVDGARGGWAVVTMGSGPPRVRKVTSLLEMLDMRLKVIAVDVPIGLLDFYEAGGRACDRAARKLLGRGRGSSVFPAPVRPVLGASSWPDACAKSCASAPYGKAISKQTFAILPKIEEVDELLCAHPDLRGVVREVHPEVCFCELVGRPIVQRKNTVHGRQERRNALSRVFPELQMIQQTGREQGLAIEDIYDAAVACWSAIRLAKGAARSLPDHIPFDAKGLPMAIWI